MKKYLSFILVVLIICTYCTSVSAQANYTYTIDNTTVIFDADTVFTLQEQQYIADLLVYGDSSDAQIYALLCVISGHAYGQGESITTITHKVYDTDPRCFMERFIISQCTRCEHYQTESLGGHYISCCPED